jgi:hypothetical protein
MKARQLIERHGSFKPEELAGLCEVLEDAWSRLEAHFDGEVAKQEGRTKLAGIIVMLARGRTLEPEQLRNDAIQTMERFLE